MKRSTLFFLMMGVSIWGICQDQGIHFSVDRSWKEVLAEAKMENKFIFLDCYASWCGPCKRMDQKVYVVDTVGRFFNENFICVKMQMDTSKSDDDVTRGHYGDAHEMLMEYRVQAYPTFLFFSPEGTVVHRGLGYQDSAGIIKLGKAAIDPDQQYYTLLRRFQNGNSLRPIQVRDLAGMAKELNDDSLAHRIGNSYINGLSYEELFKPDNLEFMYYYTTTSKDRGFELCRDSAAEIEKADTRMSKAVCRSLVIKVIYGEEIRPMETSDKGKPDWERIKANLAKYGSLGQECLEAYRPKLIFNSVVKPAMEKNPEWESTLQLMKKQNLGRGLGAEVAYAIIFYKAQLTNNPTAGCNNYFESGKYYLEHFSDVAKAPQHNELAYELFKYDTNTNELKLALQWSKYSIDSAEAKDPWIPDYMDTYSNLLYKLGQKDQAILWEEKAIKARPEDSGMPGTLKKMEAGEPTW